MSDTRNHNFWQRVSNMFRSDSPNGNGANGHGSTAVVEDADESGQEHALTHQRSSWWPRSQRPNREVSERVIELTDAMKSHFKHQDERATALSNSLDRVGQILEQVAESQRAQSEFLQQIAVNTDSAGKNAARMNDTVARVPDALHTQAEAIRKVAQQLETSQEADTELLASLKNFGTAVDTLNTNSNSQVAALRQINSTQREQQESLNTTLRDQGRKYVIAMTAAGAVGVAAIAALTVMLVMQLSA